MPGLLEAEPLTHIELLDLDRRPGHLIVIGGGYVGLEFAQAYRRFGSRVTVVHNGPQVLPSEDADVAEELRRILAAEDIEILLGAEAVDVEGRSGRGVRVRARMGDGERKLEGSDILVATGRTPNTADIGLDKTGVELDGRGYIRVDERLKTTASGVWAIASAPAARTSRMPRSTTSASSGTTWPGEAAPLAAASCRTACSRILRSRASA